MGDNGVATICSERRSLGPRYWGNLEMALGPFGRGWRPWTCLSRGIGYFAGVCAITRAQAALPTDLRKQCDEGLLHPGLQEPLAYKKQAQIHV